MGFNNDGAEAVAARLRRADAAPAAPSRRQHRQDQARPRGRRGGRRLREVGPAARPVADYLVVNVSSPNTPGLRDLQAVEQLAAACCAAVRPRRAERTPLLVKIAPDLADDDIDDVADLALELGLDGIIATNTTTSREGLPTPAAAVEAIGAGGLSGAAGPAVARGAAAAQKAVGDGIAVISVGGIATAEQARERLEAGATLVQAYTGFVYGGPLWPRRIVRGLAEE